MTRFARERRAQWLFEFFGRWWTAVRNVRRRRRDVLWDRWPRIVLGALAASAAARAHWVRALSWWRSLVLGRWVRLLVALGARRLLRLRGRSN